MKKYKITVEGKTYEVEVEELGVKNVQDELGNKKQESINPAQISQETTKPKAKPASSKASGAQKIVAPMPGTILSIKKKPGDVIKKGDVVMVLEAMKMENEILAPEDGTVVSIDVVEGSSVNTGDLLATFE
ncbi:biotin/lipoyl-containing protein [Tepidanaerobacter syntrophicus]|uniref:biotin/lipoyl-containing protein n=1 Tax=Tepidanaerobacter syntrophicus TaxID=224999 RepID=UPI001BD4F953|nr:biotin/lipoyl-containing protein [Tepidanaerobacter syntrophicus]